MGCEDHFGQGYRLRAHSFRSEGEFTLLPQPVETALGWEGNLDSCGPLWSPPLPFPHPILSRVQVSSASLPY